MQFITPILLFIVSIGIFFGYTDPSYGKIVEKKKLQAEYVEALKDLEYSDAYVPRGIGFNAPVAA